MRLFRDQCFIQVGKTVTPPLMLHVRTGADFAQGSGPYFLPFQPISHLKFPIKLWHKLVLKHT